MTIYQTSDITVPTDINLTELLHQCAWDTPLHPSHVIARDNLSNRSLTISELRDHAGRLAHGFTTRLGAKDGDNWAIIVPNSVDLIELFHAVLWTGGTGCPINHALNATDIARGLAISQPRFIIAYTGSLATIEDAVRLAQAELKQHGVVWMPPRVVTVVGKRTSKYSHLPYDFLSEEALPIPHYDDTTQRIASIHLSSGTTGSPKGIQLTHHNYISNCHQLRAHDPHQWTKDSRIVAFTPFVHIAMTTFPLFYGPWAGMLHHAMPTFNLPDYAAITRSVRPTSINNIPSIMRAFIDDPALFAQFDFSQTKLLFGIGTGTSREMHTKTLALADWQTVNLYGMTEAAPYVAYQRVGEDVPLGAVGPLLPGIKGMLKVPGTSEDAPVGGPGELWIHGPNVARRYVAVTDAEEVNRKAFPLAGWYNTGDVCTISAEGVLAVVGRTKELIKYKGFQVPPVELDAYLNRHPLVVEGAGGGLWDEAQLTEVPTGYVVLKEECRGREMEALRQIHRDVDAVVTGYKKLRGGVWEVKRLPKTPTMKVTRNELKKCVTGLCSLEESARPKPKAKL